MKKIVAVFVILALCCVAFGNLIDIWNKIPKLAKVSVGAYLVAWAWNWIFDPVIIVGDNPYGAFCFGPVIAVDRYIWYEWKTADRNYMLNHEYTHYIQHALFGPVMSLTYPVFCLYSTLKTGNRWDGNYWELQAMQAPDTAPNWKPLAVWEW